MIDGLLMPRLVQDWYPFLLDCVGVSEDCHAKLSCDEIESKEQAIFLGWRGIERDLGAISHNDIGVCPACVPEWFSEPTTPERIQG